MKKNTVNNTNTTASANAPVMSFELVRASKARRNRMKRVDKALGKGADGKYHVNGITYDTKVEACIAGRINVCTVNARVGEIGLTYNQATDFPRFAVMQSGNDRPSIPTAPRKAHDASADAYWAVPLQTVRWSMTKDFGYDKKSGKWIDPVWMDRKGKSLRYDSLAQMAANHKRHLDFVRYGVRLGYSLKEILEFDYSQVPNELGMEIHDPDTQTYFVAFSITDSIRKALAARGMSDRFSSVNRRTIWKYMLLEKASFEEALFRAVAEIGPKKIRKARYIGAEYGYVLLHSGSYSSGFWVDPNTGRRFETFPRMCKCYATTPARVETALKNGSALGTALVKTGVPLSRGAKEVFDK